MSDKKEVRTRTVFEADVKKTDILFFNHVSFTHVGTDVFIDLGVIDPAQVLEVIRGTRRNDIDFTIVKRLGCSINTLALLRRQLNEIWDRLKVDSALDPDLASRRALREKDAKEKEEAK